MTAPCAWLSLVNYDSTHTQVGWGVDKSEPGRRAVTAKRRPLPGELPLTAFVEDSYANWQELPNFFGGGGSSFTMTYEIAKPLLELDLGGTMLLPVKFLLADRKTEVWAERRYHQIPRWHLLEALDPIKSQRLEKSSYTPESPKRLISLVEPPKDDEIVLDHRALSAPAIWHDETLMSSTFFSDEAYQALKSAGVDHHFDFVRCPIAQVH